MPPKLISGSSKAWDDFNQTLSIIRHERGRRAARGSGSDIAGNRVPAADKVIKIVRKTTITMTGRSIFSSLALRLDVDVAGPDVGMSREVVESVEDEEATKVVERQGEARSCAIAAAGEEGREDTVEPDTPQRKSG